MSVKTTRQLVSVIIVNWNGKKWLQRCLDSLLAQTYPDVEIIVVDNASKDGSRQFIHKHYKTVKLVQSDSNLGFAGGNNLGLKHASGEFILLLNNDTYAEPDFLRNFVSAFDEIPNLGSAQCKLVLMDDPEKLDLAGAFWTSSSFLHYYGYAKPATEEKYNQSMPVFSNKGAAMLLRRDIINKVGLFDDDFWCYYEETDLCHRLWLAGYECWYYPAAKVYHAVGGTSLRFPNSYVQFHNFKNKLLSFLKNFEVSSLLVIIPVYLLLNVSLSLFWLFTGKARHFLALYQAIGWNTSHFSQTLKKRRRVQQLRKVRDKKIFEQVKRNPPLSYYTHLVKGTLEDYAE